ncbi:MAG TPA: helix-turn-helix domain-containing protein [Acidimicrobiia bacterium]|nr:helix-turn-helix domain-containing protein [Acidimicrobiia bacterium]
MTWRSTRKVAPSSSPGSRVHLTDREFDLIAYPARMPGRIATADQLLDDVWHSSPGWQTSRTVAEHIYRLRKKLESDPGEPRHIVTHRGRGGCFAVA